MRLRDCKYGVLVVDSDERIGMIKGITNNAPHAELSIRGEASRAVPLVEWSCGLVSGIHQCNIEIYKGEL